MIYFRYRLLDTHQYSWFFSGSGEENSGYSISRDQRDDTIEDLKEWWQIHHG